MDLKNKSELEQYFAENFDTVFFPLLADIYRKENDLNRARKVCEIGLEYHPSNIPGAFILAEINQAMGNLTQAEKYYKHILNNCPWHYRALVNLVKIEAKLNRSTETITKLWTRIVRINPTHTEARLYLKLPPVKEPKPLKITSITSDTKKKEADKKEDKVVKKAEPKEAETTIKPKVDKEEVKPIAAETEEKKTEKAEEIKEVKPHDNKTVKEKDQKEDKSIEAEIVKAEENKSDKKEEKTEKTEKKEEPPKQVDNDVEDLKKKLGTSEDESAEKDIFKEMGAKTEEIKTPKPPTIKQKKLDEEELQSLDITPRMATFTMVNVLKKQKLYQQALFVLNMLEEKGADQALIDQERTTIQELLDKSETE